VIYHPGTGDIDPAMAQIVTDDEAAVHVLRGRLAHEWTGVIPAMARDHYEHAWAVAFVNRIHALPGTGRRDVLADLLEHWDAHVPDEVDDNPERNPHAGFVPADGTGLVDDLMRWRGGDLDDSVSPFAVHTVIVDRVDGAPDPTCTVRHPVDCDRLPYGAQCAFDKVSDSGQSILLPVRCAPGEYVAQVRGTDSIEGAGEEYVEVDMTSVVRES